MAVLFVLKFHLNDFIGLINIFQGLFLLSEKNLITDLILEPLGLEEFVCGSYTQMLTTLCHLCSI